MTSGHRTVHFIYHVPKCAGQTVHRHLAMVLTGNAYHRIRKQRGWRRLLFSRYDDRKLPEPEQLSAIGGHYLGVSLDQRFSGREIKRSILLRDPVSHFISLYNYRMMRYLSQGWHPYSFELAYRATQRNRITHHVLRNFLELPWGRLLRLSDQEKYDIVNGFLASFWYVGDYTLCDDLLAALGSEFSVPAGAAPQNTSAEWNARITWRNLSQNDLPPRAIEQIRQENLLDQRIWETWRDARDQVSRVRPLALNGRSTRGFLETEVMRFPGQVMRRVRRRFGNAQPIL
jgi:hypothetical protein